MAKVELNYQLKPEPSFQALPKQAEAAPGETISFAIGKSTFVAIPDARLRITLKNPKLFSKGQVEHPRGTVGTNPLEVTLTADAKEIEEATTNGVISGYDCELFHADSDVPAFQGTGATGGDIIPPALGGGGAH